MNRRVTGAADHPPLPGDADVHATGDTLRLATGGAGVPAGGERAVRR
ncbi:hypothetical protein [Streptosporangium sp. V21-05]